MPDCKDITIASVARRLQDVINQLAITAVDVFADNLGGDVENIIHGTALSGLGVVGELTTDAVDSILGRVVSLDRSGVFGTVGSLLASVLTSLSSALLAFYIFAFSNYRRELEARVTTCTILSMEVQKLITVINFLINHKSRFKFDIQEAYNDAFNAWEFLVDAKNKQHKLNASDFSSINSTKHYLKSAQSHLQTPVLDEVWSGLNNVETYFNMKFEYNNHLEKLSIPGELREYYQNPDRLDMRREAFEVQKRNLEQYWEDSINALLNYVDSPQVVSGLLEVLYKTTSNLALYLPMSLVNLGWFVTEAALDFKNFLSSQSVSKRSLKSLNISIKKVTSILNDASKKEWGDFVELQVASNVVRSALFPAEKLLGGLVNDMEQYVEYPKTRRSRAKKSINTELGKAALFSGWNSNINTILKYVDSVDTKFVEEIVPAVRANAALETLFAHIKNRQAKYEDSNKNTPDSEAAFNLFSDYFYDVRLTLDKEDLVDARRKLYEIRSLLASTINEDEAFIQNIINFTNQAFPDVYKKIELLDKIINDPVLNEDDTIRAGLDRVRFGDISAVTSFILQDRFNLDVVLPDTLPAEVITSLATIEDTAGCVVGFFKDWKKGGKEGDYWKEADTWLEARRAVLEEQLSGKEEEGSELPTEEEVAEQNEEIAVKLEKAGQESYEGLVETCGVNL